MMTTIQFDSTSIGGLAVKIFLESINFEPERWKESQACEIEKECEVNIFGMEIPVPSELLVSPNWRCCIVEIEGTQRFLINERVVAADVLANHCSSEAIAELPIEVAALSLENLPVEDLTPLTRLSNLTNLNLRGCSLIPSIGPLASLYNLTSLDLSACTAVTDLLPLAGLLKLSSLKLYACKFLSDLSPLVNLLNVRNLDLSSCKALTDLRPLSELTHINNLNLDGCTSLVDIKPLAQLSKLSILNLSRCSTIADFSPLSALKNLTTLHLNESKSLKDLNQLGDLANLTSLHLAGCKSVRNIEALVGLPNIEILSLALCSGVAEIRPLASLAHLTDLDLSGLRSLTDLEPLSNLHNLKNLDLSACEKLTCLGNLASLKNLTALKCWGCRSISNLDALSTLPNLVSLDLTACKSLVDLNPLAALLTISTLKLGGCTSLRDISSLASLVYLSNLDLSGCNSVDDISPLASLVNLVSLDLQGCMSVADISPLSGLSRLKALNIAELNRLHSTDPLRNLAELRELNSTIHPGNVMEILAHLAVLRDDIPYISTNACDWLREADMFESERNSERERLTVTLGHAFSLLSENHEIVPHYEAFLGRNPDFTAMPWKSWLLGTVRNHDIDLLRQRVDRLMIENLSPGAVGGICAALPDDEGAGEYQEWACEWLRAMEVAFSQSARELLPVSAEICLAHAKLGESEALERWLVRFTVPSDVAALDPVQVSLARWQLARAQPEKAMAHAAAVQSPRERDPLLFELAQASLSSGTEHAGELLMMIEDATMRRELCLKLAKDEAFANSDDSLHRLVVAAGDSPQALSELIDLLPKGGNNELLQEISDLLSLNASRLLHWRIATLEKLISQIRGSA